MALFYIIDYMGIFYINVKMVLIYIRDLMGLFYIFYYKVLLYFRDMWDGFTSETSWD